MDSFFGSLTRKLGGSSTSTFDAEKVAGAIVIESMSDDEPIVLPASRRHHDTEYAYEIYVSSDHVEVECRGYDDDFSLGA